MNHPSQNICVHPRSSAAKILSPKQQVWWLNPAWVAGLMGLMVSLAAYVIPESLYLSQWRSAKYFTAESLGLCLALSGLFAFGSIAASVLTRSSKPADWKRDLPWDWIERVFWLCVVLAIAGYLAWAGAAIVRGASLSLALGVITGVKGTANEMKEVYMVTIPGVTTLVQLGIPAIILGVMLGVTRGWKKILPPILLILFLTLLRALFNSERLALIELAIPALVLYLRLCLFEFPRFETRFKTLLQFAPIGGAVFLIAIFAVFEYFRSWTTFYSGGDQTFWQFVIVRLSGYYVTAVNNGALMISRFDAVGAPFFSLHFLWRFPLTGSIMPWLYPNIKVDNALLDPFMQILDREANPEFNNSSALLPPIVDFGIPGALLFWLLAGLLCGLLYRWFLDAKPAGLLLYPIFFTGITETTRIVYWGEGRAVTAYFILVPLALVCGVWVRRAHRAQSRIERRLEWLQSH